MRKIQIIGFALLAMCAFSASVTTSAFGALEYLLAFWLINAVGFTGTLPAQVTGEILLENLSNGGAIVCSGILDGLLVEEEPTENLSDLLIEKVLTLAGVEVGELTGSALLCKP